MLSNQCIVRRCYYIALTFLTNQKWAEAMALFQRATAYANKAKNDKTLPSKTCIFIKSLYRYN